MKFPAVKDYPREIYVKDITYQIRYVNTIKGKKRLLGLCDDDAKIIWVRKTQSPRGIFRTLLHELLHAIEYEYDVLLKHNRIGVLEVALEALLTDNF